MHHDAIAKKNLTIAANGILFHIALNSWVILCYVLQDGTAVYLLMISCSSLVLLFFLFQKALLALTSHQS